MSAHIDKDAVVNAIKKALLTMDIKYCALSQLDYAKVDILCNEKLKENKYLERPFAYEFYYQLRKLLDEGSIDFGGSIVQAEVSKAYQRCFEKGYIPDFLIHMPDRKINLAVIEFKLASNSYKIKEDFEKLAEFKSNTHLRYEYAIEVILSSKADLPGITKLVQKLDSHSCKSEEIIVLILNTDLLMVKARERIKEVIIRYCSIER